MGNIHPWFNSYDSNVPHHLTYPNLNVIQLFELQVKANPQTVMLIDQNSQLTYQQVDQLSDRIRDGLLRLGCQAGDPIGLILPNNSQFVIIFLGILKMGGVVVALNPAYQQREIRYHLIDAGVKTVFALTTLEQMLTALQKESILQKVILTNENEDLSLVNDQLPKGDTSRGDNAWLIRFIDMLSIPGEAHHVVEIDLDSPAILQYSGGTTGVPKAAIGTHRNLVANVTQFGCWMSAIPDPQKPILGAIPFFHVYGMVLCMLLSIQMGVSLVLVHSARDIEGIFQAIRRHKPGIFPSVPTLFYSILHHQLLEDFREDLKSLQVCISGSAPMPIGVKTEFEKLIGGVLVEGYGLSEAPTATHCNPIKGKNKPGSIGLPLPDVICQIISLDDPQKVVLSSSEGELLIRGPQIMAGYLNNDAESRSALQDGWLHTGDIAVMDDEGYFYIKGRKKDLIKVGGLQVWPQEIEEVISTHSSVKEVAVAGVPDEYLGERPVAWIVKKDGVEDHLDEIRQLCKENLAGFKLPVDIIYIPVLPRTTVGKLLRRELIASYKK